MVQVAYVHFVSDLSVANNGFRLEWVVSGCGGTLNKPSGTIKSPNYPQAYPLNIECYWTIKTDLGSRIELNIEEYDLESAAECSFDSLTVYGGPDTTSPR